MTREPSLKIRYNFGIKFVSLQRENFNDKKRKIMAKFKDPIKEAERYLQNARLILSEKAEKEGNSYTDSKYVKMAGNTAWKGVLIALDAVTDVRKDLKSRQRPDFKDYQDAVARKDIKMSRPLLNAYLCLCLAMGYDGFTGYKIVQNSLDIGSDIVSWAAKQYKN
jgi:hypothetical protein